MDKIKKSFGKIFGGIELSWPKIIIFAIASGIYTALVCIIPQLEDTSLHTIAVTLEVWILFGIFIIMNSKSNLDAALKCFVFFLISQPLVYLLQVPFKAEGWGLFVYYRRWFIWTLLCLPMGYAGYYMKKDKWWGYLILLPMVLLTAGSYRQYLSDFVYCFPFYILITVFCAAAMLLYPNVVFSGKKVKAAGTAVSAVLIVVFTVISFVKPLIYSTDILGTVGGSDLTEEYSAALADDRYGDVSVVKSEWSDDYVVHADFKKKGETELTVTAPDGSTVTYDLVIGLFSYEINEK